MKKIMSVLFYGLEHVERFHHFKHVNDIVERWNNASINHEVLRGTFVHGGASIKNTDPAKEDIFYRDAVVFQTTYEGTSLAPSCKATCYAFMDWLREQKVSAHLVLHEEDPIPEWGPVDER